MPICFCANVVQEFKNLSLSFYSCCLHPNVLAENTPPLLQISFHWLLKKSHSSSVLLYVCPSCPFNPVTGLLYIYSSLHNFLLKATIRILHHILVFQLTSHLHQVPGNWNSLTFSGNTLPYTLFFPHSCILLVARCHPTTEQAVPVILFMLTATEFEAKILRFDSQDHDL